VLTWCPLWTHIIWYEPYDMDAEMLLLYLLKISFHVVIISGYDFKINQIETASSSKRKHFWTRVYRVKYS
jgi:hypothetical protein